MKLYRVFIFNDTLNADILRGDFNGVVFGNTPTVLIGWGMVALMGAIDEDTEYAFAHTTIPSKIHTARILFTNILMADKHNIPMGKIHNNYRLYPTILYAKSHKETT